MHTAALELSEYSPPIGQCIVAGTVGGHGAVAPMGGAVVYCFDYWQNELGFSDGTVSGPGINGNFDADPLFCDPDAGGVGLQPDSPCLPGEHGGHWCERIGARDVECGVLRVVPSTWGRIKMGAREGVEHTGVR